MSLIRVLRTAQQTLSHIFYVDETATAPTGTLTATVKRLDGTSISGSPFTYTVAGTTCSFALPGQSLLDSFTLDWSGTVAGAVVTARDYVEIVGGFLFGLAEARAAHPGLRDTTDYPTTMLAYRRTEVEQEFEEICRQAFVPRFARAILSGDDSSRLRVPHNMIRTMRAATIGSSALSAPDLAAVGISEFGVLKRPTGVLWPAGLNNVTVEYEHGWDYPTEEVRQAGILRLRSRIAATASSIPDRATSYQPGDGGFYRLSTPGRQRTGVPDVDGILERYTRGLRAVMA